MDIKRLYICNILSLELTAEYYRVEYEKLKSYCKKFELAKSEIPTNATIFAEDISWSNDFFEFCVKSKLYPLLLTDNAKNGLQVRLGLIRLDHSNNGKDDITGLVKSTREAK